MLEHLNVVRHPLVQHKLTLMREKETSTNSFRRLLREISQLLAYEITREMEMTTKHIETPLCAMDAPVIDGKKLALISILRAGNGLLDGEAKANGFDANRELADSSLIGMATPLKGPYAEGLHKLASDFHIRSLGTGAITLTYVALGIIDGCIDFRSKAWDVAAAQAFCNAAGVKVRYLDEPHFPLQTFDVHMKSRPFYAGTEAFCKACENIFGAPKTAE